MQVWNHLSKQEWAAATTSRQRGWSRTHGGRSGSVVLAAEAVRRFPRSWRPAGTARCRPTRAAGGRPGHARRSTPAGVVRNRMHFHDCFVVRVRVMSTTTYASSSRPPSVFTSRLCCTHASRGTTRRSCWRRRRATPRGGAPPSTTPAIASAASRSSKQLGKLDEKLSAVTSKAQEVGGQFTIRNDLCGSSDKSAKIDVKSTADMDNHEMVKLQRKVMKEQDAELDILEEAIASTKHIALAINEELDLQTRLIVNLDEDVEVTSNQLQRAQKRLKKLNTRMRKSSSCWGIVLSVVAVVICVAIAWALVTVIKH